MLALESFVGSPHEFVAQGVKIAVAVFSYDVDKIRGFAYGDRCVVGEAEASAVNGEQEVVVAAVDFHPDGAVIIEQYRAYVQAVGCDGCYGDAVGGGCDNRAAVAQRVAGGACRRADYDAVRLIGIEVTVVNSCFYAYHGGVVVFEYRDFIQRER